MNTNVKRILEAVERGEMTSGEALLELKAAPFEDLGYAKIDFHRSIRQGVPEVIYGAGKTKEHVLGIARTMLQNGQKTVLVTRITQETADFVRAGIPEEVPLDYNTLAQTCVIGEMPKPTGVGKIVVATGGTSDIPVAEEAAITAETLGNEVIRLYDVGVAGIHRLLAHREYITQASVIIAIAGMEGALASVVGGLADCPVIAVPTSVGYGASFQGLSALLSMLNSCASGVACVNIDNGFGAGFMASRINHMGAGK